MGLVSGYVGYLNYIVGLLLTTGVYILWVDIKNYKKDKMEKEKTAAKISGWINLTLGALMYIVSWVYKRYLW
ncbi:CLC_0170 family protein [Paenibacillus sp. HJGM_3]|uniref:CLC_0170 family protein n=1 Tax=Paenibacillus sp. HJGM_3 TaxID=3379816 RepID=UPI00385E3E4D